MFRKTVLLTLSILLAFPALAFPFEGFVQAVGEGGTISWGSGEVSVVRPLVPKAAEGDEAVEPVESAETPESLSPLAVRKAASNARKQMLDMILAVRINGKRTISAFLSENDEVAARVRGMVQNSPMQRPAVFDGNGEVRVSEAFRGKLAELVLPTTIQFQSGIPPKLSTSMEQSLDYSNETPEYVGGSATGYTGVIIDARGLQVTPALAPVVYGQDGVGAYGPFFVSRKNAIDKGVVAYAATADPATLRERVGSKPLTVRAISVFGSWRTDLIISSSMGQLVRAIMGSPEVAENCRVVIVLDEPDYVDAPVEAVDGAPEVIGEELADDAPIQEGQQPGEEQ